MQVESVSYGAAVVVLFALLLVSLLCNIFLFNRGHESYSIKYELFFKSSFFRRHPTFCSAVEFIYHLFFAVPFALLLVIAIIRAFSRPTEFVTIVLNGLIVLLTIYPIKDEWFNRSKSVVLLLVIASQLDTLYEYVGTASIDSYSVLSAIFYPINAVLFCLALLSHEQDYWELNHAIHECKDTLAAIYPAFT
jgi:hypothetical protein